MAAPRKEYRLDDLNPPISHYTDAVQCGDFLFMSGAGPFDSEMNLIGEGDVVKQCEVTCQNIEKMLSAAGMTFKDIVYFKVLLEDVSDGAAINPVRQAFSGDSRPVSTRVGVGHLAWPGMLIEIEAYAYKPQNGGPPKQEIRVESLCEPLSHYTDVVKCGDFAFLSGTGPIGPDAKALHFGDPVAQGRATMENMHKMLEAAGMGFEDVAKVICYMENIYDRPKINVARKDFFGDSRPTSTLFGIRRLAIPGMGHQIEAIAYKASGSAPKRREIRVEGYREPISHYTDGVKCGDLYFVSGSGPFDDNLKLVGGDDMTAQAVQTHDNIERILAAGGMSYEDVAKVTVYMDNTEERKVLDEVRKRYFGNTRPASTLFGANRLALFGMKLEIETIAYKPDSGD